MEIGIILVLIFVWVLVLTGIVFWILRFFQRISKGVEAGNLNQILEKVLDAQTKNSEDIKLIQKKIAFIQEEGALHIQKVGLVRFNPFGELGGDHSFALALLDGRDNGVIITGLHTRERTRVYTKNVIAGKSRIELSKEEGKALSLAVNKR